MTRARAWKFAALAVALFVAAGVTAPFLSGDRWGRAIRNSLERSLGRQVEIGEVHFNLFRGPGFTVKDVVIHEDPAFGIEPMAWVDSLEVRASLPALWTRRLEFTSLRLIDPVVNLTRTSRWNFEALLRAPGQGGAGELLAASPQILVRGGRLNFKFGDTKAVFYFANADLDLDAPSSPSGAWRLRVTGEAGRTDRPAHGMGSFTGRGVWQAASGQLALDLELERSPIGELVALAYGQDIGVHGFVIARAKLAGPLDALALTGLARVEDLHRWDQMPMRDTWPMPLRGKLNLTGQALEINSVSENQKSPVSIRYRVANWLGQPEWGVNLTWSEFPVEPLIPLARHFGLDLPDKTRATGVVEGSVGYSARETLQGQIGLKDLTVGLAGVPELKVERADLVFSGDTVRLKPLRLRAGPRNEALVEATHNWATAAAEWQFSTEEMDAAAELFRAARAPLPLIDSMTGGVWKGKLRWRRVGVGAGGWIGQVQVRNADVAIPGLASVVRVRAATAKIDGEQLTLERFQAQAAGLELTGSYQYDPDEDRPHRFQAGVPEADAAVLERLLEPSLKPAGGLLRRLGFGRAALPEALAGRHAEGQVRIAALTLAGRKLENVEARVEWDGRNVTLRELKARFGRAALSGELAVDLEGAPLYKFSGRAEGLSWRGGVAELNGTLEASGLGRALLDSLRAEGSFAVRGVEFAGAKGIRAATGSFKFSAAGGRPQAQISDMEAEIAGERYAGQGTAPAGGPLRIELAGGAKPITLSAPLFESGR